MKYFGKNHKYYTLIIFLFFGLISCNSFKSETEAANYAIGNWVGSEDLGGLVIWNKVTFNKNGTFERFSSNSKENWSQPFSTGNWKITSGNRSSDKKLVYLILLDWQSEYGHEYSAWPFVQNNKLQVVYNKEFDKEDQVGPLLSKE